MSISAGAFDDFENWVPTLEQYCLHRATFLDEVRVVKKRSVESIAGEAENVEQDEQAEQPTS